MLLQNTYDRVASRLSRDISTTFARRNVTSGLEQAVVSFTFDDFPATAYHNGAAILDEHGYAGTYYTAMGLAGQMGPSGPLFVDADLAGLLARGHELGCHTYDHLNAWETPPGEYEKSVLRNRERLAQVLPEVGFFSHSYPISCPRPRAKQVVEKYFACARGGGQCPNGSRVDANSLKSFFIEKARNDFSLIQQHIDAAKVSRTWLIFSTHDVCPDPSQFGCTMELFSRIVGYVRTAGIAVLPVSRAFALLGRT